MPSTTYFVALPFVESEEGPLPTDAVECPSAAFARSMASSLRRNSESMGAIAFERSGDPDKIDFADVKVVERYGVTPDDLLGCSLLRDPALMIGGKAEVRLRARCYCSVRPQGWES